MEQIKIPRKFVASTLMNTFKDEDYDKICHKGYDDYKEMMWLLYKKKISDKFFKKLTRLYLDETEDDVVETIKTAYKKEKEIVTKIKEIIKDLTEDEIFAKDYGVHKKLVSKLMGMCDHFKPFSYYEHIFNIEVYFILYENEI